MEAYKAFPYELRGQWVLILSAWPIYFGQQADRP